MKNKTTIGRVIELASQSKSKMLVSIVLGIAAVFLGMIPYYVIIKIAGGLYEQSLDFNTLLSFVILAILAEFFKFVLATKSMQLSHDCAYSIMENIRIKLTDKMMRVPLGAVVDTSTGKLKSMIVDTVEKLEKPLAHMLPEITANVVTPIVTISFLFLLDWRMALAALASIPVGIICMLGQMKDYENKSTQYMTACSDMDSALVEYVNGIKVIKTFNQTTTSFGKFSEAVKHYHDTTLSWWKSSMLYSSLGLTVISSSLLITLPVGAYLFMQGSIAFEILIAGLALSIGVAAPIIHASSYVDSFGIVDASIKQVAKFLNQKELKRGAETVELVGKHMEMKNATFSYEEKVVLKNVDFAPVQNGMTAIVGPSGSGKTTLAKLLAGFYEPTEGGVYLGERNIQEIPFEQFIKHISFVSQDNFLFDMSILDNIRVGNPLASDDQVVEIAKSAGCHEFIKELPKGYHTMAGDAGNLLSGGEKQRISIARAMLKSADIVILDEATAFVDPENERVIQKAIEKLVKGKTLIVIAHRLSTIRNADKIVVMNEGEIIAEGRQEELLESCELYQIMWDKHCLGKDHIIVHKESEVGL